MRRVVWSVAAILVAAILVFEARELRLAKSLCHPARVPVSAAELAELKRELPQIEEISLRTDDGLTLRGSFVPSKNGAVVVMIHGLGENRMRFEPDAKMLAKRGYGALFYDARAHGDSDGDTSTWSDREQGDLRAAIDYVVSRAGTQRVRVATLGFSVGASTVVEEAANDARVQAVVAEALWPSLHEEIVTKLGHGTIVWPAAWAAMHGQGVDFSHVRPIDRLPTLGRPFFLIAGSDDLDTPLAVSERVFAAAKQPKTLWIARGAGHGEYRSAAPAEYDERLAAFLDSALAAPKP